MKTFVIEGFELLEPDGFGIRDIRRGIVSNKIAAELWALRSPSYHSFRPIKETVTVFDTIEEFDGEALETKKLKAMNKLTPEDKIALGLA